MLDDFLSVAYQTQTRKQATFELIGLMKELPDLELRKIASGTAISDMYGYLDKQKQAYADCGPSLKSGSDDLSFLDRFKGSPLFEQALKLEQEELEAEMQDIQVRQQERAEEKNRPRLWDVKDQIRLKKRLLELQLAKSEMGGAAAAAPASPDVPAQGAGAPGDVPAEGAQDNAMGVNGAKTASARAHSLVDFAEGMGRKLARADWAKAKTAGLLNSVGAAAGASLAKEALNLGALGGVASKALGFAAKHPTLTGAGVGAGLGALTAAPGNRLSGAIGGAGTGALAGGAAPGALKAMGTAMPRLGA